MPDFAFTLSSRDDTFLALRYLLQRKKYQVTEINTSSDAISNYFTIIVQISHYGSLADVISFLDKFRQHMPVAYTKYVLDNNGITVTVRCYYSGYGNTVGGK